MGTVSKGCVVTYLWSQPARVVSNAGGTPLLVGIRPHHATQVEVGDLDTPVLVDKEIRGFEVPVQNWRLVVMQLQHSLHKADLSALPPTSTVNQAQLRLLSVRIL